MFVKCTIKEFNDYRQWIRKLKLNAIDQDFHLQNGKQAEKSRSHRNTEALLLTRQRQERARELYEKKERKKEQERQR